MCQGTSRTLSGVGIVLIILRPHLPLLRACDSSTASHRALSEGRDVIRHSKHCIASTASISGVHYMFIAAMLL